MPSITVASTQKRTALELLNTVLGELGMPATNSINSTDDTTRQLLFLANSVGEALALLPFWSELIELFTVTTTTSTVYDLPADWGVPLNGTAWDRTAKWPLIGPAVPSHWQTYQASNLPGGPRTQYRFNGLRLEVYPAPVAGLTFTHEYLSTGWALGVSGANADQRKPRLTLDSDYVLFNERLFIVAVKLAWLDAKRLDTASAQAAFSAMLEAGWAASRGAPVLSFAPTYTDELIGWGNIPDQGFGL